MAHSKTKIFKGVTVSVTYHRHCYVIVNDDENLEEAVREQIRMPNDPVLDPSEWSEDEFAVIADTEKPIKIQQRAIKRVKH